MCRPFDFRIAMFSLACDPGRAATRCRRGGDFIASAGVAVHDSGELGALTAGLTSLGELPVKAHRCAPTPRAAGSWN